MKRSKIKSYIGFAIKARKVVFGMDNITKAKGVSLILVDNNMGESGKKKLLNFALKNRIEHYRIDMKDIVCKENCKALGLKEKNLAAAIIKEIKESK